LPNVHGEKAVVYGKHNHAAKETGTRWLAEVWPYRKVTRRVQTCGQEHCLMHPATDFAVW